MHAYTCMLGKSKVNLYLDRYLSCVCPPPPWTELSWDLAGVDQAQTNCCSVARCGVAAGVLEARPYRNTSAGREEEDIPKITFHFKVATICIHFFPFKYQHKIHKIHKNLLSAPLNTHIIRKNICKYLFTCDHLLTCKPLFSILSLPWS